MSTNLRKKFFLNPSFKKVIIGASILSLVCLFIGTYQLFLRFQSSQKSAQLVNNSQSKKTQLIVALGRVEPEGEVILVGGTEGERIGELIVQEGQQVSMGSILAYLETYQEKLAEKQVAVSQLKELRLHLASETKFGNAKINEVQSHVAQVKVPQFLGIEAQQASVKRLRLELENAKITLKRFQLLQKEGAISLQNLDEKKLAFSSKQQELNYAQVILAKLIKERETNLFNAQTRIQSAQANLERLQSQILIESALQNLKLAETRLERTIIRAPKTGQILKIFAHTGETITQQGILHLGNTQQMYVVAEVYETDIQKVSIGQKATVSSKSFSGELQGIVDQIGLQIGKNDILATDPAAKVDSRVVEVKIRLKEEDSKRVAGLTNLQTTAKIYI